MMRRVKPTFRIYLLVGLMAVACEGHFNVLFLAADDMRPELGAFLGEDFPSPVHPRIHTPNLDSLAARSLVLKRAYVQQALCGPSRTSLLTGRRPDTTHAYDLSLYFRNATANFTTIPQFFKENGYSSIGIGKIFHPRDASGYDDPISWTEPYFHGVNNFEDLQNSWKAVPDALLQDKPLRDEQLASRAVETLRRFAENGSDAHSKFFLAVGFQKPHLPFVFPKSVQRFYPEEDIRLPTNPYVPGNFPDIAWYDNGELRQQYADIRTLNVSGDINSTLPDQVVKDLRRAYYCAVTWTDIQVGRVLAALDDLGLADDTLVSFFGDHGYHLGEHAEWGKVSNFELATHAPLMVRVPGLTDEGISTRELAEFVDLFPTLVEAAGFDPLPLCPEDSVGTILCREGLSLMPLIQDPDTPLRKAAFSQYPRGKNVMGYTVRTKHYRYTEWVRFSYESYRPDWTQVSGVELYDHQKDRAENFNRADDEDYSTVRTQLSDILHNGWRDSLHGALEPELVG